MAARIPRNRVARIGVDVGYKMGDGVVAFWKHAWHSEPIAVFSVVLAAIGIKSHMFFFLRVQGLAAVTDLRSTGTGFAYFGPKFSPPERVREQAAALAQGGQKKLKDY